MRASRLSAPSVSGAEPVGSPDFRLQIWRTVGGVGHLGIVGWPQRCIDHVQGQDLVLRMMDWSHDLVLGDRVDPAVLKGSGASLGPMTLHHPEHGVVEIAPNARNLGRTAAHRGEKFT